MPMRPASPPRPLTAPERLGRPPLPGPGTRPPSLRPALRQTPVGSQLVSPSGQRPASMRPYVRLTPVAAPSPASRSPLLTPPPVSSDLRLPTPLRTLLERQPLGRLGMLWSMRRSAPSPHNSPGALDIERSPSPGRAPWEPPCDLSAPAATGKVGGADQEARRQQQQEEERGKSSKKPGSQAVRVGRRRRSSFDLGFTLVPDPVQQAVRGRSCLPATPEATPGAAAAGGAAPPDSARSNRSSGRCSSVPPTGTEKADDAAAQQAKAKAILLLKQYFAEEMAKSPGQDPNEVAVRALRRLNEAPRYPVGLSATAPAGSIKAALAAAAAARAAQQGEAPEADSLAR